MLKHGSLTLSISSYGNKGFTGGSTGFGSIPLSGEDFIGFFIPFGSFGLFSVFISKIDGDLGLVGSFGFFNLLGDSFLKASCIVPP